MLNFMIGRNNRSSKFVILVTLTMLTFISDYHLAQIQIKLKFWLKVFVGHVELSIGTRVL